MQATGKTSATATRINAATGDATKINATGDVKRNAATATTLTSNPSSEVASSEITSSSEQMTTGLAAGEIN